LIVVNNNKKYRETEDDMETDDREGYERVWAE